MTPSQYLEILQGSPSQLDQMAGGHSPQAEWSFGKELLSLASELFLKDSSIEERIAIGLLNQASVNATWYRVPGTEDSYVIGITRGLVDTVSVVITDVIGSLQFDYTKSPPSPFLGSEALKHGAEDIASRIGAFLEVGAPLSADAHNRTREEDAVRFARAISTSAMKFIVLHEFAHILLGHNREELRLLRNRFTDTQIATFSVGQEHFADDLALRMFLSPDIVEPEFSDIEFAGVSAFFGVVGLLERHINLRSVFDTPHLHPPAYERLYRLRLQLSHGGSSLYWAIQEGAGFRLAGRHVEADPHAVRFSDTVSWWFLQMASKLERELENGLPSPMNSLFRDFYGEEGSCERLVVEVLRWLRVGSPERVLRGLAEARMNAKSQLLQEPPNSKHARFLSWAISAIDLAFSRCEALSDYFIRQALAGCRDWEAHAYGSPQGEEPD
jgi:hypothetical protein